MNDEPHDTDSVEVLLQRFRPAAPPEDYMQRLRAARPALTAVPAPKRAKIISFMPYLSAAAAALVAGVLTWHWMLPAPAVPAPAHSNSGMAAADVKLLSPRQSTQRLMDVRDIGIARDEHSRPVRLMHATWIDDDVYPLTEGPQPVREARVREEIVPVVLTDF